MRSPREEALLDSAIELFGELAEEFEQETGCSISNRADEEVEEYLVECLDSSERPDNDVLLRIMKKHIQE